LIGAAVQLRRGVNGVNPSSDTELLITNDFGVPQDFMQAGEAAPEAGLTFGRFLPRVALTSLIGTGVAGLIGPDGAGQAVVSSAPGTGRFIRARRGQAAPIGAGDLLFRSFLGETQGAEFDGLLIRAALSGPPGQISAANNEALISFTPGFTVPLRTLRKGEEISATPGLSPRRFLAFWSMRSPTGPGTTLGLAWVRLAGPGVSAANDCALQVEVDSHSGRYQVVASLAGAPDFANQALFRGQLREPGGRAARMPVLDLRKGTLFQTAFGEAARLRSIRLGVRGRDATGAGGKGLPSCVAGSHCGVLLDLGRRRAAALLRSP
jgi:hypothetical protein